MKEAVEGGQHEAAGATSVKPMARLWGTKDM
jgi:hypothetical protein